MPTCPGIETDLDFSASSGGETFLSGDGEVDMDWMWTIGARLGYLATPDTLIYFLIGYTQAEFDDPSLSINFGDSSETFSTSLDTSAALAWALGMETRLDANWGLKLEYRFTQLSDEQLFSISENDYNDEYQYEYVEYGASADLEPSIHTARVLLTYRFNRAPEPIEPLKQPRVLTLSPKESRAAAPGSVHCQCRARKPMSRARKRCVAAPTSLLSRTRLQECVLLANASCTSVMRCRGLSWAQRIWGRAVSSVGRALRLHRRCREFESLTAHQPAPSR